MIIPEVVLKVPEELGNYEKMLVDGIEIYADKSRIHEFKRVNFKLDSVLFLKRIIPDGLQVRVLEEEG